MKVKKKIDLSLYDHRRFYFNEIYDLTIIEIFPNEINISEYLEIDEIYLKIIPKTFL